MGILERNLIVSDISMIEVFENDNKQKKPLVLVYHGYTMNKEVMLPLCHLLADNGFFAVAIDAYMHGERNKERKPISLLNAVVNTAKEVNTIIDSYGSCSYVDTSKVGLAGVSMGGMITFEYITQCNSKAAAAITLFSTPDILSVLKNKLVVKTYKTVFGYSEEANKLDIEYCEKHQPLTRPDNIRDLPLLMINGDADIVVPVDSVNKAYNLFKETYTKKDNIELVVYPGAGHGCPDESEEAIDINNRTIKWFKKHLF